MRISDVDPAREEAPPAPRAVDRARRRLAVIVLLAVAGVFLALHASAAGDRPGSSFPPSLESYRAGEEGLSLWGVLRHRALAEPLNLVATSLFLLAILHTFLAPRLLAASHHLRERLARESADRGESEAPHSFRVEVLHFLGEVEVVFGIWVVPLVVAISIARGSRAAEAFVGGVNFTEAVFVVVIMAVASTRPVLRVAEGILGAFARLGGGTPLAWWFSILTVGPCLGSLITEPAAMIICALLLGRRVFDLDPSTRFRYGALGLLFVNVSVGGTLSHFAAPPVLMVASRFGWGFTHMLGRFGWKAVLGIVVSTALYAVVFRAEFGALKERTAAAPADGDEGRRPIPKAVTAGHLAVLALAVFAAHTPAVVIGLFLFFLAFHQATAPYQDPMDLRAPLLVGFFLAGLVVHGALQQWWIASVLGRLDALALMGGAVVLTAFNDNAAITYLASLVPDLTAHARYAVVAGAVAGGGLTVIANAPNPAGQSVLARYFPEGVSPLGLFLGAAVPTLLMTAAFLL